MGGCVSGDTVLMESGADFIMEQKLLKDDDEDFFLSSVVYSKYWDKIKLVGYQMKLRPDHLEQIKGDIGLDTELLSLVAPKNPVKAVFNDDDFGY